MSSRPKAISTRAGKILSPWTLLFAIVIVTLVSALVYKADYVGVHYDESFTVYNFTQDLHAARHNYRSTNNHVLNSVFIVFSRHLFGDYVHYVRIFPILSSLLFFLGVAYILWNILNNPALQIAAFLLVCTVKNVFDYLYIARGYTFALSAMVLYICVIFWLLNHPVRFKFWPLVTLVLSVINFYAMGAMLSAVHVMFALNAVFCLFFSFQIYRNVPKKWIVVVSHAALILLLSGVMLYLFYRPILNDVLNVEQNEFIKDIAAEWKGWASFVPFMKYLLFEWTFTESGLGRFCRWAFYLTALAGLACRIVQVRRAGGPPQRRSYLKTHRHAGLLLVFLAVYLLTVFAYAVVLKRSPGLHRNQIFMVPLVLLTGVWCMAGLRDVVTSRFAGGAILCGLTAILLLTAWQRIPSLQRLTSGVGTARPTLERLRQLDPDRQWNLCFSSKMINYAMNFRYYLLFDRYRFRITGPAECNVYLCRPDEAPPGVRVCLDYDYYMRADNCLVLLLKANEINGIILEAKPLQP